MKIFKLRKGKSRIYSLTAEEYEQTTQLKYPFKTVGKDGTTRYFAICPWCDNPIQIIGLYAKNDTPLYGKHYSRDTKIAEYNQSKYFFCPYASHQYSITRDSRKNEITDFEIEIYNTLRDNFDIAVKIIEQDTGLMISDRMAMQMLKNFLAAEGYMYCWATLYNIPWLLLFFTTDVRCYGLTIKENSPMYNALSSVREIQFENTSFDGHMIIRCKKEMYLNLHYSVLGHKRKIINDELRETMSMNFFKSVDGLPKVLFSLPIQINELRFMNWITSEKAQKYRKSPRNQRLLQIADDMMGTLKNS